MGALTQTQTPTETTQFRQKIQSRQWSPKRRISGHRSKLWLPLAILTIWAICGFFAYGLWLGHYAHEFPQNNEDVVAPVAAALGPISLAVELVMDGPHYYWRFRPLPKDQSFERNYN